MNLKGFYLKFANLTLNKNLIIFILISFALLVTSVYIKSVLLKYYGFYEPDGFFHFAVVRAAINNNFIVPNTLSLSGWPTHAEVTEPAGLYYMTVIPYAILQFFGINYYDIMRLIPILFGILDILLGYYLAKSYRKDLFFSLLVVALIALNLGLSARTSGTIYRGDSFATTFLLLALIFLVKGLKTDESKHMYLPYAATGLMLGLSTGVWNGGIFAVAIILFATVIMMSLSFITDNLKILNKVNYILLSLVIWFLIESLFLFMNVIKFVNAAFSWPLFPVILIFIGIGNLILTTLLKSKDRFRVYTCNIERRIGTIFAFGVIAFVITSIIFPAIIYNVFIANGFYIKGSNSASFASTIQELQPPTTSFLYASFGIVPFFTPMSIIMYLSTYFLNDTVAFWLLSLIAIVPYFFLDVEGQQENKLLSGNAVFRFHIEPALLILAAYYLLTEYLQMYAVRFNSLIAVPLSIFAAYTLYWLTLRLGKYKVVGIAIVVVLIVSIINTDLIYSQNLVQADQINPNFIGAMAWMKNNTPSNAVVLTLWPDGSVVEGVANRTSITDSVGSQDPSIANPFAAFLLNNSNQAQFLLNPLSSKPSYFVARYAWLIETSGIYTESELNASAYNYAYAQFTSFQENANANGTLVTLSSQQGIGAQLQISTRGNNTGINAIATFGNNASAVQRVVFFNLSDGNYSAINQTAYNQTNGGTLLVEYSDVPKPGYFINVTGAYLFNKGIAESNLFKLLFLCGPQKCEWDNNIATMQLVYNNPDTKITAVLR